MRHSKIKCLKRRSEDKKCKCNNIKQNKSNYCYIIAIAIVLSLGVIYFGALNDGLLAAAIAVVAIIALA